MTEEYARRILKSLIYIEEHIDEELSLGDLAKVACYSPFHFHRLFQAIVGEAVYSYVRRLRLEQAAVKLRHTDLPVTEIALDACYETPSAFTKAFKQRMGKSPQTYRALSEAVEERTIQLKELPMIRPDRIEKISDLNLFFVRRKGPYHSTSWEAWPAILRFVTEAHLDRAKLRYFSILHDDPNITDESKVRFDACVLAPTGAQEKGEVGRQVLKGGKYAIFTHIGPYEKLEETFTRIFCTWLPASGETQDDAVRPPFCEHLNMGAPQEKLLTKIYIPLM